MSEGPPFRAVLPDAAHEQLHPLRRYDLRGGLVFEAHRLCVSLNSRLESNKEEEEGSQMRRTNSCTRSAAMICERELVNVGEDSKIYIYIYI